MRAYPVLLLIALMVGTQVGCSKSSTTTAPPTPPTQAETKLESKPTAPEAEGNKTHQREEIKQKPPSTTPEAANGFNATDVDKTVAWLHAEFVALEKSKSNSVLYPTAQKKMREKLDGLVGSEISWTFYIQEVKEANTGKVVVKGFVRERDAGVVWTYLIVTNTIGQKGDIVVEAKGDAASAVKGNAMTLKAKIAKVIESNTKSGGKYTVCIEVESASLAFKK